MNIIKPKKLKLGDIIAIIAPSGEVNIEKVLNAKKYFENKGYKVKLGSNIEKCENYLAGTDEARLNDIHWAFSDNEIDAIICARGGYGAIRLINKIDYQLIRNNPKIFCGYSDITILNSVFLKHSGLITYSAPMAQSDFSGEINKYTETEFFKNLTSDKTEITANEPILYSDKTFAQGLLFGGNLSTITSLCGTDFVPDDKFIFFAEDLNEPVYKLDRYFTQLLNIDKFRNNITAIVLGDFLDIDNTDFENDLFTNLAKELSIPVIKGFPFTHDDKKTTVPVGGFATLDKNTLMVE